MASARVCEFCNTRFRSAKSKPICPSCGKRQLTERAVSSAPARSASPTASNNSTQANAPSAAAPTIVDWVIGIVGIGGVLLSIVAAVIGILLLFFVGLGMLVGAFAVQRLLRYLKADSPQRA